MNDKAPIYTTLAGAAVLFFFLLLVQPYSAPSVPPSPWGGPHPAGQTLPQCSLAEGLPGADEGIGIFRAGRLGTRRGQPLPRLTGRLGAEARVWSGIRHGDTAEVLFYTDTKVWTSAPSGSASWATAGNSRWWKRARPVSIRRGKRRPASAGQADVSSVIPRRSAAASTRPAGHGAHSDIPRGDPVGR